MKLQVLNLYQENTSTLKIEKKHELLMSQIIDGGALTSCWLKKRQLIVPFLDLAYL